MPAAAVAALYLYLYVTRHFAFPVGYDTPKYLWRTNLVGASGMESLPGSAPFPFRVNADRPSLPVLWSMLASVLHTSTLRVSVVFPAVMASAIGIGAGALASAALRLPRWAVPVFVIGTGTSVNVARMAAPGYNDVLILAAVVVGAAVCSLLAAEGRSVMPAVALLAAAALIHWIFAIVFAAVLAGVAVLWLPSSVRAWRKVGRARATPTARLAWALGAAALLGGVGLLALAAGEPSPPRLPRESFLTKLARDLPMYAFPIFVPLAALGAAALAVRGRAARVGMTLLALWAVSAAAAVAVLQMGASAPAHRVLSFGLGLPMLVAAGLATLAGAIASRRKVPRRAIGVLVLVAGLAASGICAYRAWSTTHPWILRRQVAQAQVAGEYLLRVGATSPVVFLIDMGGHTPLSSTALAFHVLRSALPAEVVPRTLVYLGRPDRFLERRPTLHASPPDFNRASLRHWPSVQAALAHDVVALMMPAFNRNFRQAARQHPEWLAAPSLAVVSGPRQAVSLAPVAAPAAPMGPLELGSLALAVLCVLTVAGAGWSAGLVPAGWLGRVALSPAFGIASLVVAGIVADRLGVRLAGPVGAWTPVLAAAAGWGLFATRALRERRRSHARVAT